MKTCGPGPTAPLFESKTFVDGGRALTYVQVGGNPDLWKLKSGGAHG